MKLKSPRPVRQDKSPGGFSTIARFNLEVTDDVTVYDCSLVRAPDGNVLVYGPAGRSNSNILSLSPRARRAVIEMALDAVGINDDRPQAA